MSDPLTLVQSVYAAFGRGDLPALLGLMDDGIEWQFCADRGAPVTGTAKGKGQVGEWFGAVAASEDIQAFEPLRFLAGPDHVTVIGRERTVLRATGKTFETEWVHVWRVGGGRITQFWGMLDSQAAAQARQ